MAVNGENSEVKDSPSVPLSYLEVNCKSSNKIRRFSFGTEAGFAVNLINRKLDDGLPLALYIESVKEGEEPVNFGPNSVITCYGDGWKLQTVTETEGRIRARESIRRTTKHESSPLGLDELQSTKGLLPSVMGLGYIAKVVFAFFLLFVLGAVFTLALENLPRFVRESCSVCWVGPQSKANANGREDAPVFRRLSPSTIDTNMSSIHLHEEVGRNILVKAFSSFCPCIK